MAIERHLTRGRTVVVGVLGLLLLVMLTAAVSGPEVTGVPMPSREWVTSQSNASSEPRAVPTPTASSSAERDPEVPPLGLVAVLVGALLIITVTVGIWLLVVKLRPRKPHRLRIETVAEPDHEDTAETTAAAQIRAAVDRGLQQLDESSDPRSAVLACWVRLEEIAAKTGMEVRPDDTPADLVTRVLGSRELDADILTRLADLYRLARFGPDLVESSMREEARELLERLRTDLQAPRL